MLRIELRIYWYQTVYCRIKHDQTTFRILLHWCETHMYQNRRLTVIVHMSVDGRHQPDDKQRNTECRHCCCCCCIQKCSLSQLNSTQLNTNTDRKKLQRSSRSLKKQSVVLLNNSTALQLTTHAGKLFHASIRPYSNCKIKYFLASTQTCGLKSLSSWPLSPVNDVLKKSVCLMSSKPLKILKTSIYSRCGIK